MADRLRSHGITKLVVDPVMVAKSGDRLLRQEAVAALRDIPVAAGPSRHAKHSRGRGAGRPARSSRMRTRREAASRDRRARPALRRRQGRPPRWATPIDLIFDGRDYHRARVRAGSTRRTPTAPAAPSPRPSPRCSHSDLRRSMRSQRRRSSFPTPCAPAIPSEMVTRQSITLSVSMSAARLASRSPIVPLN